MLNSTVTEAVAEAVSRAMEATLARMTALESELATTKTRLAEAEQRLEEVDQRERRNCVIISGIPEKKDESTDGLVMDVSRAAGLELSPDSIDRSHRLGRANPGKARPILVRFTGANARQRLFDKRKELSADKVTGHPTLTRSVISKTFISESLSPKNQHLLYVARQLKKRNLIWAAYTTNGRVKVKKTDSETAKHVCDIEDLAGMVDHSALREFRPPVTSRTPPAVQRGTEDATWRAADALNDWVTRRRGRNPSGGRRREDGPSA